MLIVSSCHLDYDHLKPAVDGYIRADIQYFGMVLKATDTGTSITRVITVSSITISIGIFLLSYAKIYPMLI